MSRDGPETQSLAEKLKAKQAQEFSALEDVIQRQHDQLAENLKQSSTAALRKTWKSINAQTTEIEAEMTAHVTRLKNAMAEIKSEPARLMWRSALIGAVIGGMMTLIPWGAMSYLGISVTGEARSYFERLSTIRTEEGRINALESVEILTIGTDTVLMLPATVTQIFQCGTDRTPCIKLEE